jgi:hypothetical protein
MKLTVYKKAEKAEEPTALDLIERSNGAIDVVTRRPDGLVWYHLVKFKADGTLYLYRRLQASGFKTDNNGHIETIK